MHVGDNYVRQVSPSGGAAIAGVIVKGGPQSQQGSGGGPGLPGGAQGLPGGRIRRVYWQNKSATVAHYPQIFCDLSNCGDPTAVPQQGASQTVLLPTSGTTVCSYVGPLLQPALAAGSGAAAATTLGAASQTQAITGGTAFTLTVANTSGFPASGSLYIPYTTGIVQATYTAIGSSTTFTGVYAPTGTTVGAAGPVVQVGGSDGTSTATSGGQYVFDFGVDGTWAPGGIILAASSTPMIYTALAATDAIWTIDYK